MAVLLKIGWFITYACALFILGYITTRFCFPLTIPLLSSSTNGKLNFTSSNENLTAQLQGEDSLAELASRLYSNNETTITRLDNDTSVVIPPTFGYFNFSCPFEWSKYSCSRHPRARKSLWSSTKHYAQHGDFIKSAYEGVFSFSSDNKTSTRTPRRILMVGDSLTRQLFISIACQAATTTPNLGGTATTSSWDINRIEHAEVKWKDASGSGWPCHGTPNCVRSGQHSGFDVASIRFIGGDELHFVPHSGYLSVADAEPRILDRFFKEASETGWLEFGDKTAMKASGPVDVLLYNAGVHFDLAATRASVARFVNNIGAPLLKLDLSNQGRTKVIYVTTPTQHFHSSDGQYNPVADKERTCIGHVDTNPRAEIEKELLRTGINVDALVEYDDVAYGEMHVGYGDCTHYCMPGVPDVVAARIVKALQYLL